MDPSTRVTARAAARRLGPIDIVPPAVLMAIAAVLGIVAVVIVSPGLPYDEPAHWANVLYIVENWRIPVLGDPGVTYEGQQMPVYYLLAGALAMITGEGAFVAVRVLGVVGHVALVCLTALILHSIARNRPLVVIAGTAFIALNPMLIVMSATVQNDTWAVVWGFVAIAVAVRPPAGSAWLRGAAVGVAASLAILIKVSMAPLLIALVVAYVLRRRFVEALMATAVTVVATGWWFVRNLLLYGDLTGQSAVVQTGAVFETVATTPFELVRTVLTYLTLPTEYLRNMISAPSWVDIAAIIVGGAVVVGLALLIMREHRALSGWGVMVVVLVAAAALIAWLTQVIFGWPVAFRTAYAVLPLVALAIGTSTQLFRPVWAKIGVLAVVSALQLATGLWVALSLIALGYNPLPMGS